MTEKNIKKLLVTFGVPAEKHQAIIDKSNQDEEDWDVTDVFEAAKNTITPLVKPAIEKASRNEGATGAIKKSLKAVYDSVKDESTGTFEEWQKTHEGKDYAEVIKDHFAAAKTSGVSGEQAVIEMKEKLAKAMKEKGELLAERETMKAEFDAKLSAKDFEVVWDKTIKGFEKKPLKESSYKYFKNDLADEGIEARLHEGKIALFKKGETAPLQNEKGTAFVTLEEKFNNWATENAGQFVNSAGNAGNNGTDIKLPGEKISDDGKNILIPGHRPIPAN